MVEFSLKTLGGKKGGLGQLLVAGLVIGALVGVAAFVYPYITGGLNSLANMAGLPSAAAGLGIELQDDVTVGGKIDTTGLLGAGDYLYNTVTLSHTLKHADGRNAAGTYYVWEEEPANWNNEDTIAEDYSEQVYATGSLSSGAISASLETSVAENPVEYDSTNRVIVEEKDYFVHVLISGAPDAFYVVPIPNAGGNDSVAPTLTLGQSRILDYDTSDWNDSAWDMGIATTSTDKELQEDISYRVADYNTVRVASIKLTAIDLTTEGIKKLELEFEGKNNLLYDSASNVDNTKYVGTYEWTWAAPTDTGYIAEIKEDDYINLTVKIKADTNSSTNDAGNTGNNSRLENNEKVLTITVKDPEETTLWTANLQG